MAINRVLERTNSLIYMGEKVLSTPGQTSGYVETSLFEQWRTSSLSFLKLTLGANGVHYLEFEERCKFAQTHDAKQGLGILRSVKEDIEGGYLQRIESLVSAEVFSDFLEMAKHLLDHSYKDPSASLIGAVLEDSLRRICNNSDITVKTDDNISSLNQKLADKEIYNRLQQREIEVWNKLRDYADHGHFNQYNADRVKDMLAGVGKFVAEYLK